LGDPVIEKIPKNGGDSHKVGKIRYKTAPEGFSLTKYGAKKGFNAREKKAIFDILRPSVTFNQATLLTIICW